MTTPLHERTERQLAKYGVTEEAFNDELERLHNHCPGCTRPFSTNRLPCVDHDHKTGMWRGILCTDCNWFTGTVHDDSAKLRRLADYLDNPPCEPLQMFMPGSIGEHRAGRD